MARNNPLRLWIIVGYSSLSRASSRRPEPVVLSSGIIGCVLPADADGR